MASVKMKFKLPEEEGLYRMSMYGPDYHSIISNTLNEMRSVVKYGKEGFSQEEANKWREFIWEQIRDYCVSEDF